MHKNNKLRLAALILSVALLASSGVWAADYCVSGAPSVTEEDMLHPPPGTIAFRAEILKVIPHGRMHPKPHRGFAVDYRIEKMFQGRVRKNLISVEYGGCQNFPGHAGEVINVLAIADRNVDWFAPEFWTRRE